MYLKVPRGHAIRIARNNGGPGLLQRLAKANVMATGTDDRVRMVTHLDLNDEHIERVAEAFSAIFETSR